jgi:hypothetical protein
VKKIKVASLARSAGAGHCDLSYEQAQGAEVWIQKLRKRVVILEKPQDHWGEKEREKRGGRPLYIPREVFGR